MATYNVFDLEKDEIDLGSIGSYVIGVLHQKRHNQIVAKFSTFKDSISEEADVVTVAGVVGEILEILCINADGVKDKLVDLCDVEKHGEDALAIQHLTRMVDIILEITQSNLSLGND